MGNTHSKASSASISHQKMIEVDDDSSNSSNSSSRDFTECTICYEKYDTRECIPCIGTCGHTICDRCRLSMLTSRCPQCNRKEAFAVKMINGQLLDLIGFFNLNNHRKEPNNPSNRNCANCHVHSTKLRLCLNCARTSGVLNDNCQMEDTDDVQEVARQLRKLGICGDCVLDHGHSDHQTVLLPKRAMGFEDFLRQ